MAFNETEAQVFEAFKKEFGITGPITSRSELYHIGKHMDIQKAHLYCDFMANIFYRDYANRKTIMNFADVLKNAIFVMFDPDKAKEIEGKYRAQELSEVYWHILLTEARFRQVDSYCLYLEKNRDPREKFYQPRRRKFREFGLTQGLQGLIDDEYDILCISMPPGTGKGSTLDSDVLTPDGFIKMRDVHVGSKVIAGNGNVATVIGVYPQGKRPTYRFTFDDGSSCKVSDNHLWKCQTRDDRHRGNKYRIAETTEMLKNFMVENGKRRNYSIDYVPKIDFAEKKFVIHPYILGVLIGDGCITDNMSITLPDAEIRNRISTLLPNGYRLKYKGKYDYFVNVKEAHPSGKSDYRRALEHYGLWGKHCYEKFIPSEYMFASYEQRIELLRGLLDTDGFASGNYVEYSTTSERLAKDVILLVHSLGGYATVKKKSNSGYRKADGTFVNCRDSYRITIQFSSDKPNPFYLPRKRDVFKPKRKEIKRFVTNIEYIGEEECQCIMIDDPCHLYITDDYIITHNTSMEKFFNSGVIGWFPKDYNLFYSHSGDITRMYYDGVLQICTDHDEYTWNEIFPDIAVTSTNAKMQQFNVGSYKPFPSLQTTSVGSESAGKVRASKFLLVDDMIGKMEEALNKNYLDKLWNAYSVDARQRKTNDTDGLFCKEIIIATRWSVHDVIGRIERMYEGNPRVKVLAIPATKIDEKLGVEVSNFDYDFGGFTVDNFHDQQLLMDEISYKCLYMQQPIEREGLLYHEEDMRRYSSLPSAEPDAIVGICDTKSSGIDYMFLPVCYQYGEDYYCVDCICDNSSDFDFQYRRITDLIMEHNMQQLEFESNAGGDRIAFEVSKRVEAAGGRCNITRHPTETNKETRIIVNSDWVKKHVLFKEKELYGAQSAYGKMMSFLFSYSEAGKNKNDDVPDGWAIFAEFITKRLYRFKRPTVIMKSPF